MRMLQSALKDDYARLTEKYDTLLQAQKLVKFVMAQRVLIDQENGAMVDLLNEKHALSVAATEASQYDSPVYAELDELIIRVNEKTDAFRTIMDKEQAMVSEYISMKNEYDNQREAYHMLLSEYSDESPMAF
jgi:hypothetical protein